MAKFKPQPSLVVYLDADLYSSTIFVLQQLRGFLKPGAILIFDEFWDRDHEMRAFTEFINEEKLVVEGIAGTRTLSQVAFRIKAKSRSA